MQYRKLGPKKPMGKKKLNKKTKNVLAIEAPRLLVEKADVTAIDIIQRVIPTPQTRNSFRRPKRSIVNREMNDARNFQVIALAAKMRVTPSERFKFCWKIVVEYVLIT